jgi:HPt (histidine-containing phosphotransfer) domain-containing protein
MSASLPSMTGPTVSALAQSPESQSICALDTFLDRCMGDASVAAGLLARFEQRLSTSVSEIERCIAAGDFAEAVKRVHTLKGEAGSLAANRLHQAAAELENCLRTGRADDAPRLAIAVRAEAEQFSQASAGLSQTLTNLTEAEG